MIELTCDCGHTLRPEQPPWGKSLLCPACGRQIPVPPENTHYAAERAPARSTYEQGDRPRRRPRLGDDPDDMPVGRNYTSGKAILSVVLGVCGCFLSLLAGLPAVILGFRALSEIANSRGAIKGKGLAYTGITFGVASIVLTIVVVPLAFLFPAVMSIREAAGRMTAMNNMKQLTLSMHNYNDANGHLPLAYAPVEGAPGQQGISWRTEMLPYIEQGNVYANLNPREPWDGPSNRYLQSVQVQTYQFPKDSTAPANQTYYQVFVTAPGKAPHSMFTNPGDANNRVSFATVLDGLSNTILIAEAPKAVVWAAPQDMPFDPDLISPSPLGSHYRAGSVVGMGDGSTRTISKTVDPAMLKALITRDGNEVITDPD